MKGKLILVLALLMSLRIFAQNDSTVVMNNTEVTKASKPAETTPMKLFEGQRIINMNSVEVLKKGIMEFRVVHNFDDIAGKEGGIRNFFGLDAATDIKIAFQIGVSNRSNIVLARTRGASAIRQMWEFGYKHQFMHQAADGSKPFSLTMFANIVAAANKAIPDPNSEASFGDFEDRLSEVCQLFIAKKFGSVTFQIVPSYLHRHHVIVGDDFTLWSVGAGIRIPLSRRLVLLSDYFHTFRSEESKAAYAALPAPVQFVDPFSIGLEILTAGHIFHLNFTNTKEILENRMLARTNQKWEKGQFRWAFTLSRNFVLFHDNKK